jgi:hypothetical protein
MLLSWRIGVFVLAALGGVSREIQLSSELLGVLSFLRA